MYVYDIWTLTDTQSIYITQTDTQMIDVLGVIQLKIFNEL